MEWRLNHVGQMAQSVQDYSSFGIDEADAKARALAIGKELMYAEEPEKEEDEYGTFWLE